jgi:chemotaxis protein methyltransferase CheR
MTTVTDTAPDLTPEDFGFLRDLVRRASAIELEDGKEYLVTTRLSPLVRAHALGTIAELVAQLRRDPTSPLRGEVIDAMTTNETSFFRDVHPFTALEHAIIPTLLEGKSPLDPFRVWCGASSSGQEPHSLAMLVAEKFPELFPSRFSIVATDLSPSMVARCAAGRYSQFEVNRGLPARSLVRHFEQDGTEWVLRPAIRDLIETRVLNLTESWIGIGRCDLVMLRNVLIYFSLDTKREILRRIRRDVLVPGGILMLGSSETTLNIDDEYLRREHERTVFYQTPDDHRPAINSSSSDHTLARSGGTE